MPTVVPGKLAIVGAGNMGNAIARLFAINGWTVVLIDPSDHARAASQERLSDLASQDAGVRLRWHADVSATQGADLIIEAAPEDLALKRKLFGQLEAHCSASTLIATNTSGISINQLARDLAHPERFVGTHFFTPADVIPLVEVIACERSSTATTQSIIDILRAVGKLPVLVRKDIPGFIANRLQHALAREAMSLLEQGVATADDIDTVAKWSLGIRLALTGPLEQRDINGLDIHLAIASYLYPDLESAQAPLAVLSDKVQQGHLGVKSGQGFYDWASPDRKASLRHKEAALSSLVDHIKTIQPKEH